MPLPVNGRVPLVRALSALLLANARYWLVVAPQVRDELRSWRRRAEAIDDATLRAQALEKLRRAGAHAQITATLATISPRRARAHVVTAIVALEVLYDYLDGVTEQPAASPLPSCLLLHHALEAALTVTPPDSDYYRHHPHRDGSGYLDALVATCGMAVRRLPSFGVVAPVAQQTAARCGEAQARSHAVAALGPAQLAAWAAALSSHTDLRWWEVAGGAAASVLAVHALIAAAADPRATRADAREIEEAYLPICALITLLDSLVDQDRDAVSGSHRYVSYYAGPEEASERLAAVGREAVAAAARLPHAAHHVMTVAGAAAFYLSAPEARTDAVRPVVRELAVELGPLIVPILGIFRFWRLANSARERLARCRIPRADRAVGGWLLRHRNRALLR